MLVSTAPYLLFTDGDCLLPPDHVRCHLEFRRLGRVAVGDCYRLDRDTSDRITDGALQSGEYLAWVPWRERRRLALTAILAGWHHLLGRTVRPPVAGNNIGIWRTDLERINGYDENFVGWGLEDRDLQLRLSRLGLRLYSILGRTVAYRLWHPLVAGFASNNVVTRKLAYYQPRRVATRCHAGLFERNWASGHTLSEADVLVPGCADPMDEGRDRDGPMSIPFSTCGEGESLKKAA